MLKEEILKRKIPSVINFTDGRVANKENWEQRRMEIIDILSKNMFGISPDAPQKIEYSSKTTDINYAGKAVEEILEISFETPKGIFSFPCVLVLPKTDKQVPVFVHINFRSNVPDRYHPIEEIIDNGFGAVSLYYEDIVPDTNDNFENGLATYYPRNNKMTDWGKIAMWAFACSRVMDYLQTDQRVDKKRIAVIGHSRLGKTALWCGANDTRFSAVFSNDSGCSGAALTRGNVGEQVKDILRFDCWFCKKYNEYAQNIDMLPFDQHFLIAAIAPRKVYVGSAQDDFWADPKGEFLSCVAASEVYEMLGKKPLDTKDEYPTAPTVLHGGDVGYHIRKGNHFFSREDWQYYMKFFS